MRAVVRVIYVHVQVRDREIACSMQQQQTRLQLASSSLACTLVVDELYCTTVGHLEYIHGNQYNRYNYIYKGGNNQS